MRTRERRPILSKKEMRRRSIVVLSRTGPRFALAPHHVCTLPRMPWLRVKPSGVMAPVGQYFSLPAVGAPKYPQPSAAAGLTPVFGHVEEPTASTAAATSSAAVAHSSKEGPIYGKKLI